MQGWEDHRQRAFSLWLRTGRRLPDPDGCQIERKFNPWRDPRDGRFTFAGAGRYAGPGGVRPARPIRRRAPTTDYVEDFTKPPLSSLSEADAWRARELAKHRGNPGQVAVIEARYQRYRQAFGAQADAPLIRVASVTDFAGGVGEGLYDVGKGAVAGAYALATTNPGTTVQNIGRGLATTIDRAISAEDVPASVQISRAANAIGNSSSHDLGHAMGTIGGNVGLAVAPGAAASKIVAARRVAEIGVASPVTARFGVATSSNYRNTFFSAYPGTKGTVIVHHAVEKEVLKRYPGLVSEAEIHSLENLRGIPKRLNSELHLRQIRLEWNRFHREFKSRKTIPTKADLLAKATEIDRKYRHQFRPAR